MITISVEEHPAHVLHFDAQKICDIQHKIAAGGNPGFSLPSSTEASHTSPMYFPRDLY